MEQSTSANLKSQRSIQDYLSLGYLYLLLLGITTDSIYFGYMGINILEYSTIIDVLLSPVIYLTKSFTFPFVIFITPILGLIIIRLQQKQIRKKETTQLISKEEKEKQQPKPNSRKALLVFVAVSIFSAYFGYGLGRGQKMKDKLQSGTFELNHELTFNDGEVLKVYLVDHNNQYVFYVVENGKTVTVSPVEGNIKKIKKLEK